MRKWLLLRMFNFECFKIFHCSYFLKSEYSSRGKHLNAPIFLQCHVIRKWIGKAINERLHIWGHGDLGDLDK